jgi:hypothetical protein
VHKRKKLEWKLAERKIAHIMCNFSIPISKMQKLLIFAKNLAHFGTSLRMA